jgi:hypothetical protein
MFPYLAPENVSDQSLAYSEISGQFGLANLARNVSFAYFQNNLLGEFGVPMILAALENFWIQFTNANMATFGYAIKHVSAITPSKQMYRAIARWIVAMVAYQDSLRDLAVNQFPRFTVCAARCLAPLDEFVNASIAVFVQYTRPRQAWVSFPGKGEIVLQSQYGFFEKGGAVYGVAEHSLA